MIYSWVEGVETEEQLNLVQARIERHGGRIVRRDELSEPGELNEVWVAAELTVQQASSLFDEMSPNEEQNKHGAPSYVTVYE